MSNCETAKSHSLGNRVADLTAKMREAQIDAGEMMAFHKVATMLEDSQGRINGDDLIAASFVLLEDRAPE